MDGERTSHENSSHRKDSKRNEQSKRTTEIEKTQKALTNSGYFQQAIITPEPSKIKDNKVTSSRMFTKMDL